MKRKSVIFFILGIGLMLNCIYGKNGEPVKNNLNEYAGKYVISRETGLTEGNITLVDDSTLHASTPMGGADLVYVGKDKFSVPSLGGEVLFLRDSVNKVSGLKADVPAAGMDGVEAKKVGALQ